MIDVRAFQLDRPLRSLDGVSLVVLAIGGALALLSRTAPTTLPIWLPSDFSPAVYLAIAFTVLWYVRGLGRMMPDELPSTPAISLFALGTGLIWAVLETRFLYWSQHAFFLNRIQHLVMHHAGPFLIALAWPGPVLRRGAPAFVLHLATSRPVRVSLRVLQQPIVAGTLFAGLIGFWLIPAVHLPAMLSPPLYALMNWSMVLDGLLFWFLVLDPRPWPAAPCSFPVRLATVLLVEFPQIAIGSRLTFTDQDVYPSYSLCGRLFPSIGPVIDQHIGGIVIWIPAAMMSAAAFLLVINNFRRHEDRVDGRGDGDVAIGSIVVSSAAWTGR